MLEKYYVYRVKVIQHGIIESLIKWVTGSPYCHAMIYHPKDQTFYGLDICGVEIIKKSEMRWEHVIEPHAQISFIHPKESLLKYKYSNLTNLHYLMYKVRFLRKFISYKAYRTNCVGWIRRYLGQDKTFEMLSPGEIF